MTQTNEPSDFFRTNDIGLAAYLTMSGHTLQGDEWQGQTCYWKFLLIPSVNELVELYLSRQALVEPVAYSRAVNPLRKGLVSTLYGRGND
jgi:hypothetical protein